MLQRDERPTNKEIASFIKDIHLQREFATIAQEVNNVARMFQDIRKEWGEITKRVPEVVAKVERDRKKAARKKTLTKTCARTVKAVGACSTGLTAVVGTAAFVSAAAPPVIILLPLVIPLIALVTEALEKVFDKKSAESAAHERKCQDAMETLHDVGRGLAQFTEFINTFADTWAEIEGHKTGLGKA
ncbi:unnamed protein product [Cyclocybe aegerita]|uniref:Uncharacterized protein n=1 Tax=Cyclocybe aegerita TaxID=1973307 RepID=A0A8S0X1V7_CYCAE|nr:unnamed protein product [Cyclocybe aegerita]